MKNISIIWKTFFVYIYFSRRVAPASEKSSELEQFEFHWKHRNVFFFFKCIRETTKRRIGTYNIFFDQCLLFFLVFLISSLKFISPYCSPATISHIVGRYKLLISFSPLPYGDYNLKFLATPTSWSILLHVTGNIFSRIGSNMYMYTHIYTYSKYIYTHYMKAPEISATR